MTGERFKLWRTFDLDGHTDEWDIIDSTRLDVDEGHIAEEEVVDLMNELNDEYHDMQELYDFRFIYNCLLFNQWYEHEVFEVYKSKKHHDGEVCFDGNWFVVVAILPSGQITNHYPMKYWEYFKIPSYEQVKHEFDGHTSQDVFDRLMEVI